MLRAAVLVLAILGASTAQAQEPFYKGKTVKLIAGTSAGSGADLQYRSIQRHLGRFIPGTPNVILQNMPAAGGMAASNHVYSVADKDGTELGLFNRNTLVAPVLGDAAAKFRPERFQWIGTPASYGDDAWVFLIRSDLPHKSLGELKGAREPLNIGGVGAQNPFIAILQSVFQIRMKFIVGYRAQELAIAFERKEVDGLGNGYQSVVASTPEILGKKLGRIVVQFGSDRRLPELRDVPTGRELATGEGRALIEFAEFGLALGFPFGAPPETPPERVAIMRAAFRDLMNDPEYKAEGQKLKLAYSPKLGEALQGDIARMVATPAQVVQRYKELINTAKRAP